VAFEGEQPSTWGEPAPTYDEVDESAGGGGYVHEGPVGAADGEGQKTPYQAQADQGTNAPGWGTVAPALVSGNGSRPVPGGIASPPGWPAGVAHAGVARRREHRVLRGIRSGLALTVIALALGVAAAAGLGLIVWLIATAIHHAAAS
jgi:hypothetical protein